MTKTTKMGVLFYLFFKIYFYINILKLYKYIYKKLIYIKKKINKIFLKHKNKPAFHIATVQRT